MSADDGDTPDAEQIADRQLEAYGEEKEDEAHVGQRGDGVASATGPAVYGPMITPAAT